MFALVGVGLRRTGRLPGLPRAIRPRQPARAGATRSPGAARRAEYHPLHPEVREAMKRRVAQALTHTKPGPGEAGGTLAVDDPARSRSDFARDARHRAGRRHIRPVRSRVLQPRDRPRHSGIGRRGSGSVCRTPRIWPGWDGCPG